MADIYEPLGITLTATVRHDYAPDTAETLTLYRCTLCGSLVDAGSWRSGMDQHTEWHQTLSAAVPLGGIPAGVAEREG